MSQTSPAGVWRPIASINGQRVWKFLLCCKQSVTMSSSDGSSGSGSSGSSDAEDEQHVPQVVTGANADPQVLQYFWDLASLQQVSYDPKLFMLPTRASFEGCLLVSCTLPLVRSTFHTSRALF